MKIEKIVCDFCGKELKGWEDNSGYLNIKFEINSCNKLSKFPSNKENGAQTSNHVYSDICSNCQYAINNILFNTMTEIHKLSKEVQI